MKTEDFFTKMKNYLKRNDSKFRIYGLKNRGKIPDGFVKDAETNPRILKKPKLVIQEDSVCTYKKEIGLYKINLYSSRFKDFLKIFEINEKEFFNILKIYDISPVLEVQSDKICLEKIQNKNEIDAQQQEIDNIYDFELLEKTEEVLSYRINHAIHDYLSKQGKVFDGFEFGFDGIQQDKIIIHNASVQYLELKELLINRKSLSGFDEYPILNVLFYFVKELYLEVLLGDSDKFKIRKNEYYKIFDYLSELKYKHNKDKTISSLKKHSSFIEETDYFFIFDISKIKEKIKRDIEKEKSISIDEKIKLIQKNLKNKYFMSFNVQSFVLDLAVDEKGKIIAPFLFIEK